ncbi:putative ribonuclease H-like domain-containing protein, partial [Tanacetum coccineum]
MDLKWQLSLLSVRAKKYYQKTGKKIFINGNDIAGYDKSKVECYNCHKLGHFAKECRASRSKEDQFRNQDNTSRTDQTNMALMAFSDSEIYTDKTCSKTCLNNYETLKKQYDDLLAKQHQQNMMQATYKEIRYCLKHNIPPPHPLIYNRPNKQDMSYSGLDEFKEPEFKGYAENSKERVSDHEEQDESITKPEKKNVIPTAAKIEKPVKKSVRPRIVNTARSFRTPVNTVRPRVVNTARSNRTTVNAARGNWGKPQHDDKGFVDSGCSRHMTGNIPYLSDFKQFDGGYVAFGGGAYGGKILKFDSHVAKATLDESMLGTEDMPDGNTVVTELNVVGPSTSTARSNEEDSTEEEPEDGDADDVDVHLYRSMIGSLMYLTASRPDIMFAGFSFELVAYTDSDYTGATLDRKSTTGGSKRIFRYLKGKPTLGLWYSRDSPFELVAYTDSDYAGAILDRKSTTRGISKEVGTPRYLSLVVPLTKVSDEAVHKELGDRMERAATTASSLEAEQDSGSGPRCQDTILGDVNAQTRFEITSKQSIDPPLSRGYTLGSGEDILSVLVSAVKRMLMLPVQVSAIEEGTDCLLTATIFEKLACMGYEKPSQKLTFYKAFFSPQLKYYIHTITQCLSVKSTAWNEFNSSMASLII